MALVNKERLEDFPTLELIIARHKNTVTAKISALWMLIGTTLHQRHQASAFLEPCPEKKPH